MKGESLAGFLFVGFILAIKIGILAVIFEWI